MRAHLGFSLRAIFPLPRRPLGFAALLPLLLFALAYGGVLAYLEIARVVLFTAPAAFLFLLAAPWVWWMDLGGHAGLPRARGLAALLVRLALLGLLVALMAGPRAVRTNDLLALVYAVDVSDSIGEPTADKALGFVTKTVSGKPEKDQAGLVLFGRNAAVELPPRVTFPFEAVNSRIARDGTNIEKGLSLAAAMLPDDTQGRLVLVSDGTATEGNLDPVLDDLKSRDIAVDVLPVQYAFEDEVWLEKLELPHSVKLGETYEACAILSSLRPGSGKLRLEENGETIFEQAVEYRAGKNRFVMPLYLRSPGYYEYVARIEADPAKDGWPDNNVAMGYLYLQGEGKVLVVTDPEGNPKDHEPLVKALKEAKRVVEVASAYDFPHDTLSLMPYDCVVFPNVPADAFDAAQLQALHDAVFHHGTGFLMVGGKNSFGPGGYYRSPVETVLPVSMDVTEKKVLPKGALAIILHTCEFPEGNTWAKRVTKEAIRVLGAKDVVGVLFFDYQGGEKWLFPLTPALEYERLVTLVNQAEPGDMPSFTTTMELGFKALEADDAAMKHMVIISDGDPSPPPPELVQAFLLAKVSVSMVAIYPHGGTDISTMQAIANVTGGRYYRTDDPNTLPSIFVKEAKTLRRSMIVNETFVPEVEFPSPILKGIDRLPELRGFVLTTPKPRSITVLKSPEKSEVDPVLTTWRYGVGKTAAFTSDLSTNWGAAWVSWEGYQGFLEQLVTDISRVSTPGNLHLSSFASGNDGAVTVEDHHPDASFLDLSALVGGPRGRTEEIRLKPVAPRRYQGTFPLWGAGRYQVMAVGSGKDRSERVQGGFVVPFSAEYLRFRSDPVTLSRIAERTGGRMLAGTETGEALFGEPRKPRRTSRSIADLFLVALACLVPLDVGIRRIQLDWALILGWLRIGRNRKEDAVAETLGTLLKRKREIVFAPGGEKSRPAGAAAPARGAGEKKPAPAKPGGEEGPGARGRDAQGLSTTERLLAMKRKRGREKEKK